MLPGEITRRCEEVLRRVPGHVTVLAAVKGRGPEEIRAAIRAGIHHVGENYVQEAERKRPLVPEPASWHMIGRLQRNKAHRALGVFDWLQTLDSLPLAQRLERLLSQQERDLPVLVQVNIGREPQKAGLLPEDAPEFVRKVAGLPHLRVRGLMAIPPIPRRPEDSRPYFREMRRLFEELAAEKIPGVAMEVLSMGMSADWEVAVDEGATMVRLGTLLFGPRP
ncbi:MAG: Alanine racemase domain protein [Acetothermia bacterium 64_32]|nr:MAG: Alanine racemase domain protein [Acetothermia bacterium 64_32]HAF71311.1 YggS family pyridoxal phosphate-dependent enzyme [Candidatus Acetothermia bacterium]